MTEGLIADFDYSGIAIITWANFTPRSHSQLQNQNKTGLFHLSQTELLIIFKTFRLIKC